MRALASAEYAVVGGGIVGAALAYGLARAGENVLLLDEGDVAFRAARGNFGNVWVQGKGASSPSYANLTRRAANGWAEFARQLEEDSGISLHFRRPGAFYICFTPEELHHRAGVMRSINEQAGVPSDFDILDRGELVRRLPGIGLDVAGATFCPDDGSANPLHLLRALISATAKFGGRYLSGQRVESARKDGGGFSLQAAGGVVRAASVILAAGLDNERLAPQLGMQAPVRPVRGQIMVTERIAPFLPCGTNFIRQTVEGSCVFGESSEEVGRDEGTTLRVLCETARKAIMAFPLLRDVRVVRAWGALRIMSRDGLPVYQQSPTSPRAFVLAVHSGVTLAPFHSGEMVGALRRGLLDPKTFLPFSPERFDVRAA